MEGRKTERINLSCAVLDGECGKTRGTGGRRKARGGARGERPPREVPESCRPGSPIDYEARRASLMADGDIYRVNGRRASIPT